MKKLAALLMVLMMIVAFAVSALAETTVATMLSDCESFETTDDIIFNFFVQSGNEACGDMLLDTNSALQGKNSLLFDYSMAGAMTTGKSWCTFVFAPDDWKADFGDGVRFSMKADSKVVARVVIADIDYKMKQVFINVDTKPRDYIIRWADFTPLDGVPTFDPVAATDIASADVAIISDYQPAEFDKEGKLWFDDFQFYKGSEYTTTDGRALVARKEEAKNPTSSATSTVVSSKASENELSKAPESVVSEEASATSEETAVSEESAASVTADVSEPAEDESIVSGEEKAPTENNNTVLYVIIGVVAVVIIAGAIVLLIKKKKV